MTPWTSEQDNVLRDLYLLRPGHIRLSASEIAARMGGGFTRNAIIGRIHRLGLPLRGQVKAKPKQSVPKPIRTHAIRAVWANGTSDKIRLIECPTIEEAPSRSANVEPRNIPFADLSQDDCRYPYGDGAEMVFCGLPKLEGCSYCHDHRRLVSRKSYAIDDAVTEARAKRMRGINFRRALLENMA